LECVAVSKKVLVRNSHVRQSPQPPLPDIEAHPGWRMVSQVARYLEVSEPTVYKMMKAGSLQSYCVGGRRRILVDSIKPFMMPTLDHAAVPKVVVGEFKPLWDSPIKALYPRTKRKPKSRPPIVKRTSKIGARARA
jgi:excisionase family DNA binding protein